MVGETVTYELTAQMGRGTTPGVVIEDFLNLTNGILDIRDVRIQSGAAISFTAPTPVISDSNADTYMDQVLINFGTVVNDPSLSAGATDEQIRVYIDAVVVNILNNQEGDIINNLGRLTVLEDTDGDGDADDTVVREDNVDVEIVEPTLDVTKSIPAGTTEADAGDVVGYQIVIDNSSDIDAFEVTFQDILPTQMDIQTGTFTATRTSDSGDVSAFFTVTADDINHVAPGFTLASGDSITLTYDAIVLATVTDGASLLNGVDIEWTSTPGTNADERGGDGDPNNPAGPTNPDDYENEDDAEITGELSPLYDFDKVIFSTSESHTGTALGTSPTIEDLVVGETVTYELTAQMGRGTTPGVVIEDFLNLTNGILDIRDVRIQSGAAISFVAPTPVISDSNADTYMDQVLINFGTVVNDPSLSAGATDEQIRVYIDAVVVNILNNQEGDIINNLGRLTVLEDTDGDGDADDTVVREDNVDVEIVEPTLDVTKSIPLGTTEADAGDVVGYQIVIDNSSDIDAFEVTFQDILPTQMDIQTGTFTATRTSDSGDVSAFFTVTADDINHVAPGFTLASGDSITLTYDAIVLATVTDGASLLNGVDIEWTSTPGTNADERGGDGDPNNPAGPTNPDDYENEDDAESPAS